ncbi:hypothetical protein OJJOAM_001273 [Cupriavidus sp. H18C1]
MECKVTWMGNDGMSFVAQTGSGHLVAMDGAPGGRRSQPGAAADGDGAARHRRLHRL